MHVFVKLSYAHVPEPFLRGTEKGRDLDVNYKESGNWRGRPVRNTCRELSDLFKDSGRCLCVLSLQDITFSALSAIAAKGGFRSCSPIFLRSPARASTGKFQTFPKDLLLGREGHKIRYTAGQREREGVNFVLPAQCIAKIKSVLIFERLPREMHNLVGAMFASIFTSRVPKCPHQRDLICVISRVHRSAGLLS